MQSPVKTVSNWENTNLMAQRRELRAVVHRGDQRIHVAVIEFSERGDESEYLSSFEPCVLSHIPGEDPAPEVSISFTWCGAEDS
jgi:hypothetical protein